MMKKLSITKLTKEETKALQIIKKHYGIKTSAGAGRKAIVICAMAITVQTKTNKK